ncbi:MAG TPA: hypothetical protein VGG79_07030 [Roseiarcus sp.]|jgi:hypothetical protein
MTFGAHTRNELALLLAFVDAGDVVYDIGAHIGTFAVPLAAAVGASGKLVAVEANAAITPCWRPIWLPADAYPRAAQLAPSMSSSPARGKYAAQTVAGNTGATWFEPDPAIEEGPAALGLDQLHAAQGAAESI